MSDDGHHDGVGAGRFRQVLGRVPTPVAVVTATSVDGDPVGMTIGSVFVPDPGGTTVGFLPGSTSGAWSAMRDAGTFCVNLLGDDRADLSARFARPGDRFAGVAWSTGPVGAPRLDEALAWVDCRVVSIRPVGDHDLVVGRVESAELCAETSPLVFCAGGYGTVAAASPASPPSGGTIGP